MKQMARVMLWSSVSLYAQQNIPLPVYSMALPQNQYFVVNLQNASQSTATAESIPVTQVTTIATQTQQTTTTIEPSLHSRFSSVYTLFTDYLKEHWLACTLGAAGALYAGLVAYILRTRTRIMHQHCWSKWQQHQTIDQLMQQPDGILKSQLIKEISAHYVNPQNPTDPLWPLTQFLSALKKEEAELKKYLTIAVYIKKTPFYRIVPQLHEEYVAEAVHRINFVYHLFASWSADITWERLHKIG